MDTSVAHWLVSAEAQPFIDQAHGFADPSSLSAGTILRQSLEPHLAAAVLDLEHLRRRARTKLGDLADRVFFTAAGLEQATRWEVAIWRAERMAAMGVTRVIDAGCGLGIDALACQEAGMTVIGIERDPVTAILADANLHLGSGTAQVLVQDLEDSGSWLSDLGGLATTQEGLTAIFLDPARRTSRGRSWDIRDLSPSWEFVTSIFDEAQGPVVVKLAPGFPRHLLPEGVDVTWVSHRRELVETTVWSWAGGVGCRQAVVLAVSTQPPGHPAEGRTPGSQTMDFSEQPNSGPYVGRRGSCLRQDDRGVEYPDSRPYIRRPGVEHPDSKPYIRRPGVEDPDSRPYVGRRGSCLWQDDRGVEYTDSRPYTLCITAEPLPSPGAIGRYIYEPDPAVIRARGLAALAELTSTHPLAESVAYLTGDAEVHSPFAEVFEVLHCMPFSEKTLRAWVREQQIGSLEIKVRGLDIDPADLRRRLRLTGRNYTSVILTPTQIGKQAFIVRRIRLSPSSQ
ncbi:MAG: class I SAM-dependent methyltransferase [Propionibacteriaceae bacterium]|nr:class I SAM-dependent methyltransferase [Propionibacteriaceae bacterium]